jgi:predicted DNA-binding transcriptional regulator AlpA
MRVESHSERPDQVESALPEISRMHARQMKARQCVKIKEIGEKLRAAGYLTLRDQAQILGLSRSTTWAVLRANHKASGLSAALINRMLRAPRLPPAVGEVILEYVKEKAAGQYGHSEAVRHKFAKNLFGPNLRTKKQNLWSSR